MSQELEGKVALVAGATRGAGRGIAIELGAAGATVYVTGRTTRSNVPSITGRKQLKRLPSWCKTQAAGELPFKSTTWTRRKCRH